MGYVVAHCRKVQTAVGLRNVASHNCREAVWDAKWRPLGELPDYITHPERAHLNEGDRCGGLAVLARRTDKLQKTELTRKPQKNASSAIEITISASPEWFEGKTPDKWRTYLEDARRFIENRYGKENVLHWATHYDEKSPHLHALFVPIVRTEKGLKYTSSEFLGGRQGLRELQTEISDKVGRKHGLERGIEGSKARHTDQYEYAAAVKQQAKKVVEDAKYIQQVAKQQTEYKAQLEDWVKEHDALADKKARARLDAKLKTLPANLRKAVQEALDREEGR